MRIAYILTTLGIGGAEKQVIALAERMTARGHAVTLISLKHTDEECAARLPILRLNLRKAPLSIARGVQFAVRFLILFRPDILHSHTFPGNIFARLLRLYMMVWRVRPPIAINTIHNVYEGGWHRRLMYRLTGSLADCITAVSSAAAERYPAMRNKVHVLTNGIDVRAFTSDRVRRKSTRVFMQAKDRFIWLAIGRLAPAKDYPNLLRAWAQIHEQHQTARLWIAGAGHVSEVITQNDLIGTATRHNSGVEWLGLRRDIADLLDAADGFVLSSAWEGMPLVIGEAMAMQKPLVATDVGGVRELVGDAGLLVSASDSQALAGAMLHIMTMNDQQRHSLGKQARERIELYFSMQTKADEWERLYQQLMPPEHE